MQLSYIGRTTRLARPSVRLSVRPTVCPVRARNSKTKKRRKIKIDVDVPHATSKWNVNFQFEMSKVKVTGRKTSKIWRQLAGGSAGGSSAAGTDCTLRIRHC